MATKRTTELQAMDVEALQNELSNLNEEMGKMKFDHAVRGLQNPMELRKMRKEIARLHTELRARALAGMSAEELEGRTKIRERRR